MKKDYLIDKYMPLNFEHTKYSIVPIIGTVQYDAKVDILSFTQNGEFVYIENYIKNDVYNNLENFSFLKFIIKIKNLQNEISKEYNEYINKNNKQFLGIQLNSDKLYIYLNKNIKIKEEFKSTSLPNCYSNDDIDIVIQITQQAAVVALTDYKKSIFKFLDIYPEFKENIANYIDLDNIDTNK